MIRNLALLSILVFKACAWTSPASAGEPQTDAPQLKPDRESDPPPSQPIGGSRIKVLLVGGRGHDWKGFHAAIAPVLKKTGGFDLTVDVLGLGLW